MGDFLNDATILEIDAHSLTPSALASAFSNAGATLHNFTPANTKILRASIMHAASGLKRSLHFDVGDSLPAGYTAGGADNLVGARKFAYPAQQAKMLKTAGLVASADYAVGDGGITIVGEGGIEVLPQYDPRVTINGSGISLLTGFNALGGSMWQLQNAGDNYIFAPGQPFDTVGIVTAFNTSPGIQGSFTISFDGGATAYTVANIADNAPHYLEFAVPAGATANSVKIGQNAGFAFISLVGTRLSTAPMGMEFVNCGCAGQQIGVLAEAPTTSGDINTWNTRAALVAMCSFDTTIKKTFRLNGWYNDRTNSQTPAQCQAALETMIASLSPLGECYYTGYPPLDPGTIPLADFTTYQAAMFEVALDLGIPYVDYTGKFEPYGVMQPLGIYGDNIHYDGSGHAGIARLWKSVIDWLA